MARKLIALIPTYGKTAEQVVKELGDAFQKYQKKKKQQKKTPPKLSTPPK